MDWITAGVTLLVGAISGYAKNKIGYKHEIQDKLTAYQGSLKDANDNIKKAYATYNSTRDTISSTYGSDVFAMLERQYNQVNNIKGNAISKGKIKEYNTDTNSAGEKLYASTDRFFLAGPKDTTNAEYVSIDYESDFDKRKFNTNTLTNEDGESIVDLLYNQLSSGDSALAQQLRLSGNQLATMLGTAQDQVTQSMRSGIDTIKQSAMQLHSQNLSNALEIASSRATMASSGIRNTGTGNANESLTRLQADLTSAYYAMNIKSQAMQLESEIYNTQKSASLSAYQTRAEIEYTKRKNLEQAVSTFGSGAIESEMYVKEASDNAEEANEYLDALKGVQNESWWNKVWGYY